MAAIGAQIYTCELRTKFFLARNEVLVNLSALRGLHTDDEGLTLTLADMPPVVVLLTMGKPDAHSMHQLINRAWSNYRNGAAPARETAEGDAHTEPPIPAATTNTEKRPASTHTEKITRKSQRKK